MFLYNYTVDLPFSKNQINFRELNTQEQILLAKANLNYNSDLETLESRNLWFIKNNGFLNI